MTEPGDIQRPDDGSRSESTGGDAAVVLPTRRSLRAQRENEAVPAVEPHVRAVPVAPRPPAASVAVPAAKPSASTGPKGKKKRSVFSSLVTLLVVPGVFLTVALPAYAFAPGSGETQFKASGAHVLAEANAQSVEVPSVSAKITVARDGYTAVSGAEIRRKTEEAQRAARAQAAAEAAAKVKAQGGSYSSPGARQEGDDYPWPGGPVGVLSPLNYEYRECVDFVAWRLNRDAGATGPWKWVWSNMTPGGGSAWNWANAWESHGWAVSHDPIVGSVAWFTYNHVAYVQSVNGDGTVTIEEYNQNSDHNYHRRTIATGSVALFLYPPP
ncbi:CHAP domain-containing protein [Rathayibacter sp. YIM 133350]|uniref:CHAP domain-containing protein n=1 Tax=Rathayibacter sp. YIM 133350 TaxID=3131992 RepID=UPI00307F64A2